MNNYRIAERNGKFWIEVEVISTERNFIQHLFSLKGKETSEWRRVDTKGWTRFRSLHFANIKLPEQTFEEYNTKEKAEEKIKEFTAETKYHYL